MLDGPEIEGRVGVAVRSLRHFLNGHHPDSPVHGGGRVAAVASAASEEQAGEEVPWAFVAVTAMRERGVQGRKWVTRSNIKGQRGLTIDRTKKARSKHSSAACLHFSSVDPLQIDQLRKTYRPHRK